MITLSNTQHWLNEQTIKRPNSRAILTPKKELTYQELLNECSTTATYLFSLGIKEGDRVGILFEHSYEFFVTVNALWFIGSIPVPLNTRNTIEEIQNQLNLADIKFLIIDELLQSQFASLIFQNKTYLNEVTKYEAQSTKHKVRSTKFEVRSTKYEVRSTKYEILHSTPACRQARFYILNSALIMFTSGSTGKPKAVVHTFNSLLESVRATDSFADLSPDDIWLPSLPLYHIGGFMILIRSLLAGSSVAFPVSLKFEEIKQSIIQSNPTYISLVSTTLQKFLAEKVYPDKNLKYIFLGGGPTEKQLCLDAVENGYPIVKVYGSTETCSMVTALHPDELKSKPDSVGKMLGTSKIKSMSKSKNDLGEVAVFSKSLFKEYYNDQLTTDKVLKNGWYYTGDYGYLDDEGYLYIESRREDLIITGGENVSTFEVEAAIKSNERVNDAFVFGVENQMWGQIVCAVLVSNNLSEDEIRGFLKKKIAGYKIPKQLFFIESIPRNEMGKVNRTELLKLLNLS